MGNDNGGKPSSRRQWLFQFRLVRAGAAVAIIGIILAAAAMISHSIQNNSTTATRQSLRLRLLGDGLLRRTSAAAPPPPNRPNFCEPWPTCALPPRPPSYRSLSLCDVLDRWSPDDPRRPPFAVVPPSSSLLPRFDVSVGAEAALALKYREAELPFLITGIPALTAAGKRWEDRAYLRSVFAEEMDRSDYKVEESRSNNTFLYFSKKKIGRQWRDFAPPQVERGDLGYADFDAMTERLDGPDGYTQNTEPLLYTGISASSGGDMPWIIDALPFLVGDGSLDPEPTLFIPFPSEDWKGINCRFGMKGIVQTAHYDGHRNMIAMVRGSKRYVLSPPRACPHLELFPRGHPAARHASFEWADPRERARRARGPFCSERDTPAVDVVLEAGDVLYLPRFWFHYIVSLDRSMQCNSRSGKGGTGLDVINECGF